MAIADHNGLPIAMHIESASRHETKLVEETLNKRFLHKKPRRLVGDKAYDDDGSDKRLRELKIKLIAPQRRNRKKKATQDGREWQRYKRR